MHLRPNLPHRSGGGEEKDGVGGDDDHGRADGGPSVRRKRSGDGGWTAGQERELARAVEQSVQRVRKILQPGRRLCRIVVDRISTVCSGGFGRRHATSPQIIN
ncbi:hypothetical protein LINPERPRIM_LOCUS18484 [Linum perenne]